MVHIEHRATPKKQVVEESNPYNLIPLIINGISTYGRPIEFDSEPCNGTALNKDGVLIKPTKCAVTCPQCGSGLYPELPAVCPIPYDIKCTSLGPCALYPEISPEPSMPNPFRNAITDCGLLLTIEDTDSSIVLDINEVRLPNDNLTAAERMAKRQ